jgi:hypothetical protein
MFLDDQLRFTNASLLRGNRASKRGRSVQMDGGVVTYMLLSPPGYWVAAVEWRAVESNDDSSATVQLRATRSTVRDRIGAFKLQASNDLLATKTLNRRRECARSAVSLFIL